MGSGRIFHRSQWDWSSGWVRVGVKGAKDESCIFDLSTCKDERGRRGDLSQDSRQGSQQAKGPVLPGGLVRASWRQWAWSGAGPCAAPRLVPSRGTSSLGPVLQTLRIAPSHTFRARWGFASFKLHWALLGAEI